MNSLLLIIKKINNVKLLEIGFGITDKRCKLLLSAALMYRCIDLDNFSDKLFGVGGVFDILLSSKCIYKAIEITKTIKDKNQRSHAYNLISMKLFELGLIRNAVEILRKAECFIESDMNKSLIEKGYYEEAMDASLKFAPNRYCVTTLNKIIKHSLDKGKYKKALDIVKRFQESGKFTDDFFINSAYNQIVDFLVKHKLFTEARAVAALMSDKKSAWLKKSVIEQIQKASAV